MGIGRIASLLNSLSPAADQASSAASADQVPDEAERRANGVSDQSDFTQRGRNGDPNDIVAQLQTMVAAVRALNENAVQQGAAVAVSPAGTQLKNAVTGLGHLLAAVNAQAMASGAAAPVREASDLIDSVEAGLAGTQAAAEQMMRNLPVQQAMRAQEMSDRFQAEMRAAVRLVRGALGGLSVRN